MNKIIPVSSKKEICLKWILLCSCAVLPAAFSLWFSTPYQTFDYHLYQLLQQAPFYLSEHTANSDGINAGIMFNINNLVQLYFAAVLLREKSLARRAHIMWMSVLITLLLPFVGVILDIRISILPLLVGSLAMGLASCLIPLFRINREQSA